MDSKTNQLTNRKPPLASFPDSNLSITQLWWCRYGIFFLEEEVPKMFLLWVPSLITIAIVIDPATSRRGNFSLFSRISSGRVYRRGREGKIKFRRGGCSDFLRRKTDGAWANWHYYYYYYCYHYIQREDDEDGRESVCDYYRRPSRQDDESRTRAFGSLKFIFASRIECNTPPPPLCRQCWWQNTIAKSSRRDLFIK